jgi:chromosome transmission fidelity protein 1
LICASLTWLRKFKSTKFEVSIQEAGEAYKDEPAWLVDQLLRRKREELVQRWEDREKRLEAIRLKEKALDERGRKRRRLDDSNASGNRNAIEADEAEWLLDAGEDGHAVAPDALSGLSKESREVLERIGLGGPRKKEEDDDILEEEVKVREELTNQPHAPRFPLVTVLVDLLYLENPFATGAVYSRTAPSGIPFFIASFSR